MNQRILLIALSLFLLTGCGSLSPAEKAAHAMAETACLLFEQTTTAEDLSEKTAAIMESYGFKEAAEIDTYLSTIQGTEEMNAVKVATRDALQSECGKVLTEKGVEPAELAEAMVTQ